MSEEEQRAFFTTTVTKDYILLSIPGGNFAKVMLSSNNWESELYHYIREQREFIIAAANSLKSTDEH